MSTPDAIDRIKDKAGSVDDGPVTMLNINRYHSDVSFPTGEHYVAYLADLEDTVGSVGGDVLWRTPVHGQVIGCDHENYDEILAVWYPSFQAFLALSDAPGAGRMFEGRKRCVAHATILELPGDRSPLSP